MAGFESHKADLAALGVRVFAASADPLDKAREVAATLSFPIGYAVTSDMAERLGSRWEARRNFIQPAEFIVGADGKIIASSYSDGPLGRIDAADVVRLIKFYESRR